MPLPTSFSTPRQAAVVGCARSMGLLCVAGLLSLGWITIVASAAAAAERVSNPPVFVEVQRSRAALAVLEAEPANWDADAEPDGWLATVALFDAAGQPVRIRGTATFELTPQVPSADLTSFELLAEERLRWSGRVATDGQGCATLRLPLRRNGPDAAWGRRSAAGPNHPHWGPPHWGPLWGVLRVRVAVPSAGVFEAEAVVPLRPPMPLETVW
ncbi:hypothetical protein [Candidatus Laterigemmans baculatus]|uniref:hypothetical protein n=1 Tax=Candidatus Laterigemmans baculatus TaxID=2770505 RepID=UPI0013DC93C2|nr:hypothetical protein [Candidatus Laterigemmans baculatus]